jgi:acetylornithine/N-succinyldiaminopimelate aminotransferase
MGIRATTQNVLMNNYGERTIQLVRGEGVYVYDETDKRYLDFTSGIAVCNLGHAYGPVTSAVQRQVEQLVHCSNLFLHPIQVEVASELVRLSGLDQVFFCNSGTEANEAAIKLARRYAYESGHTNRTKIVSLPHAFHGRTYGSLSITPRVKYHLGFGPLVSDTVSPERIEDVLNEIDERTAACFVEVVQGEGGVRPIPNELLRAIEQKCREQGALLVVDEVQTGVGRTGTFFAYEQTGIRPDIVTLAKGLANGLPIGAVLARADVATAFGPGSHGSTFGGNPVALAAAKVVIDTIGRADFLGHVRQMGEKLKQIVQQFGDDVTGRGLMLGMSVDNAADYVRRAAEEGVLLTVAGEGRVRFLPPLIITEAHLEELESRLDCINHQIH